MEAYTKISVCKNFKPFDKQYSSMCQPKSGSFPCSKSALPRGSFVTTNLANSFDNKIPNNKRENSFCVKSMADSGGMDSGSMDGLGIPEVRRVDEKQGKPAESSSSSSDTNTNWEKSGKNAQAASIFSTTNQNPQSKVEEGNTVATARTADWEKWEKLFQAVEERFKILVALKSQINEAVENQDFQEAAKLKSAFDNCACADPLATSLAEIQAALRLEDYKRVVKIRNESANDLVGWWSAQAEDVEDPVGRIIQILPWKGRLIARAYTAKNIVDKSGGARVFEIFVDQNEDGSYCHQPVHIAIPPAPFPQLDSPIRLDLDKNVRRPKMNIAELESGPENAEQGSGNAAAPEEGEPGDPKEEEVLGKIFGYLRDKLPGLGNQVPIVNASEIGFTPEMIRKLQENSKKGPDTDSAESAESGPDGSGTDAEVPGGARDPKLAPAKPLFLRLPAVVERSGKDQFRFLKVEDAAWDVPEPAVVVEAVPSAETGEAAPQRQYKLSSVSSYLRRGLITKATRFRRIAIEKSNLDPLSGLYVGAFGSSTSEVVQLTRKFGKWGDDSSDSPPYEYVEAVKLTGDPNVPAGQVTFRAKIGRQLRLSSPGLFPEEFGLTARYSGKGRLAEPGFKKPRWVEGELILLDGRGKNLMHGAELGFVYSVPEKHFLVLFNRLDLTKFA